MLFYSSHFYNLLLKYKKKIWQNMVVHKCYLVLLCACLSNLNGIGLWMSMQSPLVNQLTRMSNNTLFDASWPATVISVTNFAFGEYITLFKCIRELMRTTEGRYTNVFSIELIGYSFCEWFKCFIQSQLFSKYNKLDYLYEKFI